ncbi:AAA family ATPase [Citrobacter sp. S2-9]|uniref:AAA family ATPase n=1 Tax=Citrobacter enshiensis TaxID=2971264 RepID=A0ABT8PQN5_9ENTR|nr:AAA family ATPase [Citrobacter enshiensis]MDN8598650.1 AAA family ATPase [Citrobacter enshiensis]
MQFNIDIKNFGKIQEAKLNIRPFTVIAGPNSSGKSFVTKALYSFFNTINNDHVTSLAYSYIIKMKSLINQIYSDLSRPSAEELYLLDGLFHSIEDIEKTINEEFRVNTYIQQIYGLPLLEADCKKIQKSYDELKNVISTKVKYDKVQKHFDAIRMLLSNMGRLINDPSVILADEIERGFINELKENFQVTKLSDLKNHKASLDDAICFDFDSLGTIKIKDEHVDFRLTSTSIDDFQSLYNVVYLESPIYWKLKDSLEQIRQNRRIFSFSLRGRNETLSGIPKHFFDLLDLLKNRAKDDSSFSSSPFAKSIKEAIGGDLIISSTGEIVFIENGSSKSVNLHSTALGITNLGIISLLLERGVISKGSYLFIDEPEVNLHPSWQKIMIETLFNLSINGISVVIASHSIDMMKCIENVMKDNESLVDIGHFGINQLTSKGNSVEDYENPFKRIAAIKNDLGQSFYDMFLDGDF